MALMHSTSNESLLLGDCTMMVFVPCLDGLYHADMSYVKISIKEEDFRKISILQSWIFFFLLLPGGEFNEDLNKKHKRAAVN